MVCEWCGSFSFDPENYCDKCVDNKERKMNDYLEISCAPYDEPCAQVGEPDYAVKARHECRVYANQLKRMFPEGDFGVKSFPHDFGTYYEVVAYMYDEATENAAYEAERNGPANWDDVALAQLATKVS